MPGTGHSARYKGSISNRSKVSPFEQLAKWNQQLLGADGAVPSIVNGGDLQFKKLDASDIAGVMHNPATEDLNMNNFNIFNATNITLSGTLRIDATTSDMLITNTTGIGSISKPGGQIRITSSDIVGGLAESAVFTLQAAATTPNATISLTDTRKNSKIEIGHASVGAANTDLRQIKIGVTSSGYNGGEQIDIGSTSIGGITNAINIGNTAANCRLYLKGGGGAGVGPGIQIGSGGGTKLGFLGATPALRSAYGVLGPNLGGGANLAQTVAMVQKIHDALVTVGLCEI
jgi:hypothetical protein